MQVNIIKEHSEYKIGLTEVTDERGNYLIRMGIAEAVAPEAEEQPEPMEEVKDEKDEHTESPEKVEPVHHSKKKKITKP